MTRFIVVRHGQTQWNLEARIQGHRDSALTEAGVRQAQAIAARLATESFDVLVASDLGRAQYTARAIADRTGHAVFTDPRLRERNYGAAEGLTYGELDVQFPDVFSKVRPVDPDFEVPGGETRRAFHDRVKDAFEALAREQAGKRIAVVCHGGVMAMLYRIIHGLGLAAPHPIPIVNASYNALAYARGAWTVEAWGDTAHLGAVAAFVEP